MVHEYGTWFHSCMTTWKTGSNRFSFTKVEISNRKTFANVLFHSGDDWSFCQLNLSTKVFQFQVGNRKPSVYAGANWEATENCSFCGTSVHSGILTSLSHPAEVDAPWLSVDVHEVVDQPCLKVAWTQCVWNMCVCVSQGVCARRMTAYASPCNVPVGLMTVYIVVGCISRHYTSTGG